MLYATIGAALFSSKAIFIKLSYRYGVDAETAITLRMLFSLPFFVGIAWWGSRNSSAEPLSKRQHQAIIVLGLLGYYLASYLDFLGLKYISAALERLILYLYPTVVLLLSALIFKKPVTVRGVVALLISYGGIVLVFQHEFLIAWRAAKADAVVIGGLLVFGSAVTYAIYLVGSGETIKKVGSVRFTAYAMTISCLACFVQFLVMRPMGALVQPLPVYVYMGIVAIFCTVIPTFMVSEAIRHVGANSASLAGASGPVATLALGAWLLAEPVSSIQIIGAALVIVGVLVITIAKK